MKKVEDLVRRVWGMMEKLDVRIYQAGNGYVYEKEGGEWELR